MANNFNCLIQSKILDKKGKFIKRWCQELEYISVDHIHDPWHMPLDAQKSIEMLIGINYPLVNCGKYIKKN